MQHPIEELVNCTPHEITVGDTRIPASGHIARLEAIELGAYSSWFRGVPVTRVEYGRLVGLPAPVYGTRYIVSLPCALARPRPVRWLWHEPREDLLVPYLEVRDEAGQPVGCRMLAKAV